MIKIVQGNDINLHIPLVEKDASGNITPIDAAALTELSVVINKNGQSIIDLPHSTSDNQVVVALSETLQRGMYSVLITAKNNGVDICYNERRAFEIVPYNENATYTDYISDVDITLDPAIFVAAKMDDADIIALKQRLQRAVQETEAAQAQYDQAKDALVEAATTIGSLSNYTLFARITEEDIDSLFDDTNVNN